MPLWMRVDKAISRHMIWLVLSGLAIGILFPDTFSPVRAWAGILMATITFCNSLSGSFRKIGHVLLHPLPAFVILLLLHGVMPVLGLLMPAVFNAVLVGWELAVYIGGGFWINALYVAIGEAAVLFTLGWLLHRVIKKQRLDVLLFGK